jgi:hypothetical protein
MTTWAILQNIEDLYTIRLRLRASSVEPHTLAENRLSGLSRYGAEVTCLLSPVHVYSTCKGLKHRRTRAGKKVYECMMTLPRDLTAGGVA